MNNDAFFASVKKQFFKGKFNQGQVDTLNNIIAECTEQKIFDYRFVAYILATAYAESYSKNDNIQWLPVREGFAKTNAGSIAAVTHLYNIGKIGTNYALPKKNGLSYYGRGWVQITHDYNYKKVGAYYGIDLYNNPDLALRRDVAAKLLVGGMLEGWYTTLKLADFITTKKTDFVQARRIVNRLDRATEIAGYAEDFYKAMIIL